MCVKSHDPTYICTVKLQISVQFTPDRMMFGLGKIGTFIRCTREMFVVLTFRIRLFKVNCKFSDSIKIE